MVWSRISLAAIAIAVTGCLSRSYRYVDVAGPAAAHRAAIEARAHELGFDVEHERGRTLLMHDNSPPVALAVGFFPLDGQHTRIELSHDLELSRQVLPGKDVVFHPDEFGWSEWLGIGIDASVGAGIAYDPEHHASRRIDAGLHITKRLHRFGHIDAAETGRWSLLAGTGVGVRLGPEGAAFRPELSLGLAHQRAAWYGPWWQLPTGPRTVVDLSIAGLIEERGRRGFEVGVAVKRPEWAGFYVRAGELSSSPTASGGMTFSVGIDAGTIPSIAGLATAALVATIAYSAGMSVAHGFEVLEGD